MNEIFLKILPPSLRGVKGGLIFMDLRCYGGYDAFESRKESNAAIFILPALKGWAITKCPFKGANDNSPPFQRRDDEEVSFFALSRCKHNYGSSY